jgi:arylsulfatase A-like enzyme
MADDQGWGDVGYRGHPVLKTPVIDEMARNGLLLERFYAAAPVCSPTRSSVLTGRHPNRYGCFSWGHSIRPQEVTVAEALKTAGYATGHFGKWHVGGVNAIADTSPGASGFDEWLSSPNFFENNPLMSHKGNVVETNGEGSQVTVDAALGFIRAASKRNQPFLAVVWFGSPHAPHEAFERDRRPYAAESEKLQHFYGEITAMDRAIGNLREELRALGIANNTLLWYNSDNGAIPVGSTGGLSGRKGDLEEGGIRVPCVLEWPGRITTPRVSHVPCGTVDIYPTLVELSGANVRKQVKPLDGVSIGRLIDGRMQSRAKPLGFWVYPAKGIQKNSDAILRAIRSGTASLPESAPKMENGRTDDEFPGFSAWIDGDYKLHRKNTSATGGTVYSLFDIASDPQEKHDLAAIQSERVARMKRDLQAWLESVARSYTGADYS